MTEIDFIGSENVVNIESPGRINIIGEHTDYNNCFVLPTTIDKKIRFTFKKNDSLDYCNVYSKNFEAGFAINILYSEKIEEFVSDVSQACINKFNKKSATFGATLSERRIRINN